MLFCIFEEKVKKVCMGSSILNTQSHFMSKVHVWEKCYKIAYSFMCLYKNGIVYYMFEKTIEFVNWKYGF